jgi:hypothetical protein
MPKKRLKEIAEEYGVPFPEATEMVFEELEEEMVTGKGLNLWINEDGQKILDDLFPMPMIFRGQVIGQPQNWNYVSVYLKEKAQKVYVRIPSRLKRKLDNKVIYFEADNSGPETKYKWIKTPSRV